MNKERLKELFEKAVKISYEQGQCYDQKGWDIAEEELKKIEDEFSEIIDRS